MHLRSTLSGLLLVSCTASAQDIPYIPFDVTPMALNAAYTGMFQGSVPASAFYQRHQQTKE